jgi:hypothetical protein
MSQIGVYSRSPVKKFKQPVQVHVESPKRAKWDQRGTGQKNGASIAQSALIDYDTSQVVAGSSAVPLPFPKDSPGPHPYVAPKVSTPSKKLLFAMEEERLTRKQWEEESRVLAKKLAQKEMKTSEKRKFIVGSTLAPSYERLCKVILEKGMNAHKLRGMPTPTPKQHLTQGEGDIDSFVVAFKHLGLKRGMRFLDVGSGKGHMVLLAGLFGADSVGIEISEEFYNVSLELLDEYDEQVIPLWLESQLAKKSREGVLTEETAEIEGPNVNFHWADMFSLTWSGYDVIYACSTCFGSAMCKRIAKKANEEIDDRTVVLSVSRPFHDMDLFHQMKCNFTWGADTLYFHRRSMEQQNSVAAEANAMGDNTDDASVLINVPGSR